MKNLDVLSALFVGIDVSAASNVVCAIDFHFNKLWSFRFLIITPVQLKLQNVSAL